MSDLTAITTKFWQHQTEGIKYLHSHHGGLLMMGVGTGKTLTALEYIKQAHHQKILIVGTKHSIYTWEKQAKDFGYEFAIKTFNEGTIKSRAVELSSFMRSDGLRIAVINYEATIKKVMSTVLERLPLDCILYDEVHRLRSYRSQQSKTAFILAKAHPKAARIGLTGTLIYNKPLDVFGIFRFIDSRVFGTHWTPFKETYAIWKGQFGQIPVRYINQEQLHAKVCNNSYIVDRHAVLDLPPEQHIELDVHLDNKEQEVYNTFNKEYVAELNTVTFTAKNILDKVNKLQQLTSGFIYQNNETLPFSKAKSLVLSELLEEVEDHVVIFYKYQAGLDTLRQVAKDASKPFYIISGLYDEYADWASCDVPSILAVQITSGAEGIDLTKAGITVFYDMVYSYGQFEQAVGRTSRPNQTRSNLLFYYLVCRNTIDEKIVEALKEKKDLIDYLIQRRDT